MCAAGLRFIIHYLCVVVATFVDGEVCLLHVGSVITWRFFGKGDILCLRKRISIFGQIMSVRISQKFGTESFPLKFSLDSQIAVPVYPRDTCCSGEIKIMNFRRMFMKCCFLWYLCAVYSPNVSIALI